MLHVAIARFIDDQQNFGVYKEVIKEILQYGALRDIKNKDGLTPEKMVEGLQDKIVLQTRDDYIENEVQFDPHSPPENQYKKLMFYLGYDSRESSLCCPKHAPLEKVKRSKGKMMAFLVSNLVIILT